MTSRGVEPLSRCHDVGVRRNVTEHVEPDVEPWFANRESEALLLYRVNRRPLLQASLFAEQPPDFFAHLLSVLLFGEVVDTGRQYQRFWRLGNRVVDERDNMLMGQIGYERAQHRPTDRYDEQTQAWTDDVSLTEATARAPFVIDGETRILAILRHPTFREETLPSVFTELLNQGEQRAFEYPTTEWDVEPILDETDFLTWLRSAEAVQRVTFVAKLPNPAGLPEFRPVWQRMEQRRAKAMRELMEARDPDLGLNEIEEDEIARAYVAMASEGYGYVTGRRKYRGRPEQYDQRRRVRKRHIAPVATWTDIFLQVVGVLLEERQRQRDRG
jgi:hypothetical protein